MRDQNAFRELSGEILHPGEYIHSNSFLDTLTNLMVPLPPDFEKLATAFFNGDPIPADLEDIPTSRDAAQFEAGIPVKNHAINYDSSDWKYLLEQGIYQEPLMCRFLVDVILCNHIERVCSSRHSTYYNASVHRDGSYLLVVNSLKIAETRQAFLKESPTNDDLWNVSLVRIQNAGADDEISEEEDAEQSVDFAVTANSLSEPPPVKTRKKKMKKKKCLRGTCKATDEKPAGEASSQGPDAEDVLPNIECDQRKEEHLSSQDKDICLNLVPQGQSGDVAQPADVAQLVAPIGGIAGTRAHLALQDSITETIEDPDSGDGWSIVRTKGSQRLKGASRGPSRGDLLGSIGDFQGARARSSFSVVSLG